MQQATVELAASVFPRCADCTHPWHGLACRVPTSSGRAPTCACDTSFSSRAHPSTEE